MNENIRTNADSPRPLGDSPEEREKRLNVKSNSLKPVSESEPDRIKSLLEKLRRQNAFNLAALLGNLEKRNAAKLKKLGVKEPQIMRLCRPSKD
jgi:hypothetical protein